MNQDAEILLPNSDPADMVPAFNKASDISDGKPTIDSITRGASASGYLKELCEYYPNDRIAPGLQSAWLPDKSCYYVSVHRFPNGTIAGRTVIAKATSETLEEAEHQCMAIWRTIAKQVEEARRNALASSN